MQPKRIALPALALLLLAVGFAVFATRDAGEPPGAAVETLPESRALGSDSSPETPALAEPAARERTAADATAAGPPTAAAASLEVLVREPLETPVPGALLVLFRGGRVLGAERTAADGVARFEAPGGAGDWVLCADGWAMARGTLELSPGKRAITLVEDATVAGRVLVDGAPPREPLELVWSTSPNVVVPVDWKELSVPVRKVIAERRGRVSEIETRTLPDGSFRFRGLTHDVQGRLVWGGALFLEDPAEGSDYRNLAVPAPRTDLLVRLVTGVELRLRVVDDAGAPVKGAVGHWEFLPDAGRAQPPLRTIADGAGRIVFSLRRRAVAPIRWKLARTSLATPRTFEFRPPQDLVAVWDLGDVAIATTREITVLVQDERGEKILDAQATAWLDRTLDMGARTTKTGKVKLQVAEDPCTIGVQAFGYLGALVDVPAGVAEVTAVLGPACVVEFTRQPEIPNPEGLTFELSAATPLFVDESSSEPLSMRWTGGSLPVRQRDGISVLARGRGYGGNWTFGALTPGQPLRAIVRSAGREVCAVDVAPLAPGERRVVVLPIGESQRTLRLRVLRPTGAPLPLAEVFAAADESQPSRFGIVGHTNSAGEVDVRTFESSGTFLIRAST